MKPSIYIAAIAEGKVEESARTGNRKILLDVEKRFYERANKINQYRDVLEKEMQTQAQKIRSRIENEHELRKSTVDHQSIYEDFRPTFPDHKPNFDLDARNIIMDDIVNDTAADFYANVMRAQEQFQNSKQNQGSLKKKPRLPKTFSVLAKQILYEEDLKPA